MINTFSIRVKSTFLSSIFIFIFCFVLIFDPTNKIFHLKEAVSFLLILLIPMVFKKISYSINFLLFIFYCLFILLETFFAGVFSELSIDYDFYFGFVKSFFVLFILSFFSYEEFEKPFFFTLFMLVITSLAIYVIALYDLSSIATFINYLHSEVENAFIGERHYGDIIIYMVYYKTIPLVILLIAYLLNKKLFFLAGITSLVLFISGTRANMFAAIIIPFVYLFLNVSRQKKIILFLSLIAFLIFIYPFVFDVLLSTSEKSNSIKLGHFDSYVKLFESFPLILLFGSGAGSHMFSSGNGMMVLNTELVLFDLIRFIGVFFTAFFYVFILIPVKNIYKKDKIMAFSYVLYIVVATTNPLLISSTGFLAISFAYLYAYKNKGEKKIYDSN